LRGGIRLGNDLSGGLELEVEEGFLRFDFTGWEYEQRQAQQRGYTTSSQKMALGVVRSF